MNIGEKIKKRRIELELTLEDVGNAVGVSKSTVKKWEDGFIENMKRDKIALLSRILKVSPLYILELEDEPIKIPPKLNKSEQKLINTFNRLNDIGKDEALKRIGELTYISKYIKNDKIFMVAEATENYTQPIAAHLDGELTDEIKDFIDNF